jgi:mRNA interferase MazF
MGTNETGGKGNYMSFHQGDIVKFNFDPSLGHEQAGYRPALVISQSLFNTKTNQLIVCPITGKSKPYPTRIQIPENKKTIVKGFVICDHIKTIDIDIRTPKFIEKIDGNTLDMVLAIISSLIKKES